MVPAQGLWEKADLWMRCKDQRSRGWGEGCSGGHRGSQGSKSTVCGPTVVDTGRPACVHSPRGSSHGRASGCLLGAVGQHRAIRWGKGAARWGCRPGGGAAKYLPSLGRDPSAAPPYKVSLLGAYRWLPRSFRSVLWSRSEAVNWGSPPRGPGPAEPPSHVPEGSVTQFPPLRVGRGAGVQGACQTLLVSEKESAPSPVCVCESVCECLCVCENVCDSVNV